MYSQITVLYPYPARSGASAVASQSLTVSTAAVAFATVFDQNDCPLVTFDIQGVDVRVRWDGTDPSGTVGHILPATTAYTWSQAQFTAAKFIRISTASSDATIFASPMAN